MPRSRTRENMGRKIRQQREELGYSQEMFAQLIGMDKGHLARIETSSQNAKIETYVRVINALGVTFADFFDDDLFRVMERDAIVVPPIKHMTDEEKLLQAISKDPGVTIPTLATICGFSESKTYRLLKTLKTAGRLRRTGSRKTGQWTVVEAADIDS